MESWRFSESLGLERVRRLETAPDFGAICEAVAATRSVLCFHIDVGWRDPDLRRVVAVFEVGDVVFDWFFNSERGYRGAYFISPEQGVAANRALVDALTPQVLAASGSSSDLAQMSLGGESAKLWPLEVGRRFCVHCEGEWAASSSNEPEIFNGRWERGSDGLYWGAQAPMGTKVKLMGALVTAEGDVYVAPHKRDRARQIHDTGWT